MKVSSLVPQPPHTEPFRRDRIKLVPPTAGCYVLATAMGHILYMGLAHNLSARMAQHLDTDKVKVTIEGRAMVYWWLTADNIEALERGWLNQHRVTEGRLPILNKMDSPVSC